MCGEQAHWDLFFLVMCCLDEPVWLGAGRARVWSVWVVVVGVGGSIFFLPCGFSVLACCFAKIEPAGGV